MNSERKSNFEHIENAEIKLLEMCLEYETVRSIRYRVNRSREGGGEDVDTKYKETDRFDNGKQTVSEI